MKRLLSVFALVFSICILVSLSADGPYILLTAEADSVSEFIDYIDSRLFQIRDLSDKQCFVLNASGTSPDQGEVFFDFSKGNHTLLIVADAKCKVYAQFEHDELLGMLFHMIEAFDEINAATPDKNLFYTVRLSDGDSFELDPSNIARYFSEPR